MMPRCKTEDIPAIWTVIPKLTPMNSEDALLTVGNKEMADNYRQAITDGEEDDFEETDNAYYDFEPSLCDCLEEFIWVNRNVIFD